MPLDFDERIKKLETLLIERPHAVRKLSGVPFIIFTYPPDDELKVIEEIEVFIEKLEYKDKKVASLDARDLIFSILEEKDIVDSVIEVEKDDIDELGSGLKSVLFEGVGKDTGALPGLILSKMESADIAVLHHLGILYPFSSLSVLFSNLENKVYKPLVDFYPAKKEGKTLEFLNKSKGSYYRAKVI